jgi:hypothetical protein
MSAEPRSHDPEMTCREAMRLHAPIRARWRPWDWRSHLVSPAVACVMTDAQLDREEWCAADDGASASVALDLSRRLRRAADRN